MALSRCAWWSAAWWFCLVASELWDAETRPIDFVCDRDSRRDMNTVAEMEAILRDCNGLTTLSSPVKLPCIKVHKASWESKTQQEKRRDIIAALGVLIEAVRTARALGQSQCVPTLLQRLERSINNYLHILTHLELKDQQGSLESPALSCVAQSTQSPGAILWTLDRLITGKLEWLMDALEDRCTIQ